MLPYRARGGVLLPILGRPTARRWNSGEIELRYDAGEGSFSAWYFEHRLPIDPERYGEILRNDRHGGRRGRQRRRASAFSRSPRATRGSRHPNRKEAPAFKAELQGSTAAPTSSSAGSTPIGRTGPAGADLALHRLLERQHYRLGALAAGLQRHQLPALLRHQRAGRACGSRTPARFDAIHAWSRG